MIEAEKKTIYVHDTLEKVDTISLEVDSKKVDDEFVEPTSVEMKALLRKLDIRIIPLISFMYLCSFVGRFDVGDKMYTPNQNIENLISLSMPFIAYPLIEIPSSLILKAIGPSKWFPIVVITRAMAVFRLSMVASLAESLILRFILTAAEASLYSGLIFSIRAWYPKIKKEQEIRLIYLNLYSYVSIGFAASVTYATMQLDDLHYLRGLWWITSIATNPISLLIILSYFALPDFPENFKFLTEREHNIIRCLHADANESEQPVLAWQSLRLPNRDFRRYYNSILYIFNINFLCCLVYNMTTGLSSTSVIVGITFIQIDDWFSTTISAFQCLLEMKVLLCSLDIRIVPLIGFMYLCSFVGRFDAGEKMYTPNRYIENLISLSMPFIAYPLFEVPANMLLKKIGPSIWCPLMVTMRALALIRLSTVTSLAASLVLRFILTLAEASLFSGLIFSIRAWYPKIRKVQEMRLIYLSLCSYVSICFAASVTYATMQLDGLNYLRGVLEWITIISYNPCPYVLLWSALFLPDFPENNKFLTLTERQQNVIRHLHADADDSEQPVLAWKPFKLTTLDFREYYNSVLYIYSVNLLCSMVYNMTTDLSSSSAIVGITFIQIDDWFSITIAGFQCLDLSMTFSLSAPLLLNEAFSRLQNRNNS
ncbi:hypothetical protein NQZ79_g8004 [Umbelopsis isabellina]|nr:hypothetical protein NQZ79_g8004 [Umbelopsis isabellina]